MNVKIDPSRISGTIQAPASKSSMQRACAAAFLYNGTTVIRNPGSSNDDLAALGIIQKLGAFVSMDEHGDYIVKQKGGAVSYDYSGIIDCAESGLSLRMFTPIAALSHGEIIVTGHGSLLKRPVDFFDEIFPILQIAIDSNLGLLPLKIKGPLQPVDITINGSLSSQFLTGLLFAYAVACKKPVTIKVENLKSKPYIDLTLEVMHHFGWKIDHMDYKEFYFTPFTGQALPAITYSVEGDHSNAAFLFVAAAISGSIKVEGLTLNSSQGDKAIIGVLQNAGAKVLADANSISVSSGLLQPFTFDATHSPDLFPPLVALAAYCKGISRISGVSRLAHKESNRALTLQHEFEKMGVKISLQNDEMIIEGGEIVIGTMVHSNNDHRIAMATAVAGLGANGPVIIQQAEAVEKSYPGFFNDLVHLNVSLQKNINDTFAAAGS
ncbi:MAG: 3-phosphoshikimate 1-carboxyvinyltransferase [Ginsengibacter sp.]